MGKPSRDKGARVERLIVNLLNEAGLDACRVPLSGATEYAKGDIDIRLADMTLVGEVKARNKLPGWMRDWLGENDWLVLKEDRQPPMVVMTFDQFAALCRRGM